MLALIAGTGDLPLALLERLPVRPLVCAMSGFHTAITPDVTFRIEHLGSFLAELKARGITQVCMAGAVKRPSIDPTAIDVATQPLVPRIADAISQGDDGALRAIIAIFEQAGLGVKAAHQIAPDLLPGAGVLTRTKITFDAQHDAALADQTLREMGRADVGQSCIVRGGCVLAREDQSGTDAMIARFMPDGDPLLGAPETRGGAILFKGPKPDQDRRADLPVIGVQTAKGAVAAGFAGIVIAHDGVMVLGIAEVIETLDRAGLFLWVRPKGGA